MPESQRPWKISGELADVINDERMRLTSAQTIMRCATIAFEYCDFTRPDRPDFACVAFVVGDIMNSVIDNLDRALMMTEHLLAEGAGFEPAKGVTLSRVQAERVKPLRQPSKRKRSS